MKLNIFSYTEGPLAILFSWTLSSLCSFIYWVSGYIFKWEPTGLPNKLNVVCEKIDKYSVLLGALYSALERWGCLDMGLGVVWSQQGQAVSQARDWDFSVGICWIKLSIRHLDVKMDWNLDTWVQMGRGICSRDGKLGVTVAEMLVSATTPMVASSEECS